MREIIIDLDSSTSAKSFKKDEVVNESKPSLIHYEEFNKVEQFIIDAIARTNKIVDTSDEEYSDDFFEHNTISDSGSRGSGKTSFLLSVRDHCKKTKPKIEVPEVIDPTLIEDKGHIFLNILSLLSDLMSNSLNQRECKNDPHILSDKKNWEMKLQKLAEGVPSINGVESNIQGWHDAQFVMKTGLSQVKAARKLRKHFNILIDTVLKELGKEALLLIFDDIDVDSSKGWQLLETLRKYCTSPKLITIISGDEKLYLNLVRQQKWQGFGKEILKYEATHATNGPSKLKYFNDIVTNLSGQYLQKILPTRYRIHLNALLEKRLNKDYGVIKIKRRAGQETIEIGELYSEIIGQAMGITNPTQGEVFITFMLDQSLRTQLQFLSAAVSVKNSQSEKSFPEVSIENGRIEHAKKLTDTIVDLFHQDMQEQNLDLERFGHSPKFQNILSLRWLVEQGTLRDLYQLQPITTDPSINASLFTLSARTADSLRHGNTFLIFDYFIRIAYTRNLMDFIGENKMESTVRGGVAVQDSPKSRLQMLCEVSWLFSDTVLRDSVNQMHGFIYGVLNPPFHGGPGLFNDFIRLRGLEKTRKKKKEDNRIDGVLDRKDIPRIKQILGYIPAFRLSFSGSYKNSSEICYSIHSLLSTVGEIVKRHNILYTDEQGKEQEIERSLTSLSQLREYPIIFLDGQRARSGQPDLDDNGFLESTIGIDFEQQLPEFSKALSAWCDSGLSLFVAPHLLGKAFTRFYFSLKGISDENNRQARLGQILHLQIVAFFNSVLIEEALEDPTLKFQQLNIGGIRTSHVNFVSNLNTISERDKDSKDIQKEMLPLSRWLMQCPLLLAYLNFEKELYDSLQVLNKVDIQWIADLRICDTLNQIDIKSQDNSPSLEEEAKDSDLVHLKTSLNADQKRIYTLKGYGFSRSFIEDSRNNNAILEKIGNEFGADKSARSALSNLRKYLKNNPSAW